MTRDTFEIDHTKPVVVGLSAPPPSNAPTDERIDYVHDQLESLGPDAEVLNGLVLCGGRLKGGALRYADLFVLSNPPTNTTQKTNARCVGPSSFSNSVIVNGIQQVR